ncbi:unnamed protein product [Bursaphelenchus xylophilus]|uniref:(pine wood nematode) hypothetical protein n=1 Tax=Bursaphelenchus xylophilus TaxID=6326 RepID=A0A1I7RM38_BURXY|nr:unnamed protein product [Bursaphelenchus xylophilus]CAG9118180.1 unnamed protein product [Bursaphelenchus xylophilus]
MYHSDYSTRPATAAELLEASKKLYVQTEFLKRHRVDPNAPRIFKTPSEEELEGMYQNADDFTVVDIRPSNGMMFCVASRPTKSGARQTEVLRNSVNSAFQPLHKPPPRPPKSEQLKMKLSAFQSDSNSRKENAPLPNYEELTLQRRKKAAESQKPRPQPPPRPSLMSSRDELQTRIESRPAPQPRRRQTTTFFGAIDTYPEMTQSTYIDRPSSQMVERSTSTTNLTKSTPDLTVDVSPATPSVTPTTQVDSSYLSNGTSSSQQTSARSINSPDSGASSWKPPVTAKLSKMIEMKKPPLQQTASLKPQDSAAKPPAIPSSSLRRSISSKAVDSKLPGTSVNLKVVDNDFEERVQRWERRRTVGNNLGIATITAAPGLTTSWMEMPSTQDVEELFDSQGVDPTLLAHSPPTPSSDIPSDFTSITAQKERQDSPDEETVLYSVTCTTQAPPERPVSLMEKNARVLRWIHGCSMATNC